MLECGRHGRAQIPVTPPTQFSLYGNATDSYLITATLADWSTVDYYGAKDSNGLATTVTASVTTYVNGNSAIMNYNAAGQPTEFHGSAGGNILVNWTSASQGTITAVSSDGTARLGPANFSLPTGSTGTGSMARNSIATTVRAMQSRQLGMQSRHRALDASSTSTTPITTVAVTRCSGRHESEGRNSSRHMAALRELLLRWRKDGKKQRAKGTSDRH